MSEAALQRLAETQAAMAAALDAQDIAALEALLSPMAQAVGEIASAGGWHGRADLRETILASLRQADAVRGRINFHADRANRRFDRLASLAGVHRPQAYSRSGYRG